MNKKELRELCEKAMIHDDLVDIARGWLSKPWRNASNEGHGSCSVVLTDMTSAAPETPDAIGWHSGHSTLVECKISVSDFKADKNKWFRRNPEMGVGDWRYFMTPKGLVDIEKLPAGWGLIEVSNSGKTRVKKTSERFQANRNEELKMLLSLLCRLRIDPSRYVKIRAYTIDDVKEPRATVTLNSVPALLDENERLAARVAELEEQRDNTLQINDHLVQQVNEQAEELERYAAEIVREREEVRSMHTSYQGRTAEVDRLRDERDALRLQLREAEAEADNLDRERHQIIEWSMEHKPDFKDLTSILGGERDEYATKLSEAEKVVERLREAISHASSQYADLKSLKEDGDQEQHKFEAELLDRAQAAEAEMDRLRENQTCLCGRLAQVADIHCPHCMDEYCQNMRHPERLPEPPEGGE